MAIATYTLQVNATDGSQNTGYPSGDKPGVVLVAPDSVTASATSISTIDVNWNYNSSGHDGMEVQQWVTGISSAWGTVATEGPTTRYYGATGLPTRSHVGHRVRAVDSVTGSTSAWSAEAWTDTLAEAVPPAQGVIFGDDFSSYPVGTFLEWVTPPTAIPGARWASSNADYEEDRPVIVSGGYGGDAKALGFPFSPRNNGKDYAFSEQRWYMCDTPESAIWEIWAEYYIYWPAEYELARNANNKTFDLLSLQFGKNVSTHYAGDYWVDCESWPKSDKNRTVMAQNVSMARDGYRQNWGHAQDDWATEPYSGNNFQGSNPFNPTDNPDNTKAFWDKYVDSNQWRRYRFHCRPATGRGQYNALYEVWKDNKKIVEVKNSDFCDETILGFDSGYLFGWQNSGVMRDATVKISRVNMWATDPQWSF